MTGFFVDLYDFEFDIEGVNDLVFVTVKFLDSWLGNVSGRFKTIIE